MWLYNIMADAPAQVPTSTGWMLFGASLILLAGILAYFLKRAN